MQLIDGTAVCPGDQYFFCGEIHRILRIPVHIGETEIYSFDEESREYYLDITVLDFGDNLLMPDSQERFTVSKRATLIGVYNMNKGYADFRQIQILYQNGPEYYFLFLLIITISFVFLHVLLFIN